MKPLDVINSVDFGYRLTWTERRYLTRLAIAPMIIKFICLAAVIQLGWGRQYFAAALVMLPSFFADGWMFSHLSRLVFLDQRWPFRSSGNAGQDSALLNDRAYGVMAGVLFFVLSKFLLSGLVASLSGAQMAAQTQISNGQLHSDPTGITMLAALGLLALTLWGFRFVFLYIPAAAGFGTRILTRSSRSFILSLQMMGVYLVAFVPLALIGLYLAESLLPIPDSSGDVKWDVQIAVLLGQVIVDTLVGLISTASIAYGLKMMMIDEATP